MFLKIAFASENFMMKACWQSTISDLLEGI